MHSAFLYHAIHNVWTWAGCLPVVNEWRNGDTEDQLQYSLVEGIDEFIVENTEEAGVNENLYPIPLNMIQRPLINRISVVGDLFLELERHFYHRLLNRQV